MALRNPETATEHAIRAGICRRATCLIASVRVL
jgi:hypothetical protein